MKKENLIVADGFDLKPSVSILRKAIQFFLPILYLLISSSFYLRTYDSAQVKITLLQMGGFSLVAMWISLIILEGKKAFTMDDFVFLAPFIAYLAYICFSFINEPYKQWAIDDFVRYVLYTFISLIIIREFDLPALDRLTKFLLASAWIAIAYGIVQWIDVNYFPPRGVGAGFDPFVWRGAFLKRIFSTYGNPNFFANYLVLMLPIIIAQFLKKRSVPLLFLGALDIFCIVNTYTKGAWIGFGISFLIFIAIYIYYFTSLNKKIIRWIYIGFVFLAILIAGGVVQYALKTSKSSVPFRVATWLSTWEMIETHPLIGSGVGSFRPLYPAYRRPIIFHIEGKHNTETDHSENEHLEQILDNGILGSGIFYWIIIFTTITGLRAIKFNVTNKEKERAFDILGYLVAFLGMLIHNFTDVSMRFVSSGVYFGLLPAVIVNLSRGHALWEFHYMGGEQKKNNLLIQSDQNIAVKILNFLAIGVLLFFAYKIISEFSIVQGGFSNFNETGDTILWLCGWGVLLFIIGYLCYTFFRVLIKTSNIFIPLIVMFFFLPFSRFPIYYFWGWFKGDMEHNMAIFFSRQGKWDEALTYYNKVVKDNPTFIMAYYFMGNVFTDRFDMNKFYREDWGDRNNIARTDFDRALDMYEKVRSIAPNYVQTHYQVGSLYLKMAEFQRSHGKNDEAFGYLDMAMKRFDLYQNLDPVFPYNYFKRAQIWIYKRDFKKAAEEYLHYLDAWKCHSHKFLAAQSVYGVDHRDPKIYPGLQEVYTNLAGIYFMMGDYKKAYENYKTALDIDPSFELAKKNIATVRGMIGMK
ncbi:MAG: tetratricopeptide repeat protein [Elusimicrobia bacterium]|nr:tetratricopeptide repeat protein [Elusimicrobiota bacterium]